MVENIEIILSLVVTVAGFVTSTVAFASKYIKSHFLHRVAEDRLQIRDVLLGFIIEAEKFLNLSGKEKKEFVMERIETFAHETGTTYNAERVSKKIDEIIALAKVVNAK
jgi:hypothetical protein